MKLLTMKHWQLFLLMVITPFALQIILIYFISKKSSFDSIYIVIPVLLMLCGTVYFSWFFVLGTRLYKKLPPSIPMNINRFKLLLVSNCVYIIFIAILILLISSSIIDIGRSYPALLAIIIPLHLFAMFCIVYCIYFIAKALKSVELQRPLKFDDFAGEFFSIWFFPIGIWILQPRINKIFSNN